MEPEWYTTAKAKGLVTEGKGVNAHALAGLAASNKTVAGTLLEEVLAACTEAEFQEMVVAVAKQHNWRIAAIRKVLVKMGELTHYETPMGVDGKGWPDLVLMRDRIVYAELKTNTGSQSKEQKVWMETIISAGGEYHLWRPKHWGEILETLQDNRA